MADPEHVRVLQKGVQNWNEWRREHPWVLPDLSYAKGLPTRLCDANFSETNLVGAELGHDLENSNFAKADLSKTNLAKAYFRRAYLPEANLVGAKLSGADFTDADLQSANLSMADLTEATLNQSKLRNANLSEAVLVAADLINCDASYANLQSADLRFASLIRTNLSYSDLRTAKLKGARFGKTELGGTDFSGTDGLDTCQHYYPSVIDNQTLAKSGKLPLTFLRGCGLSETLIEYIPSLINHPIQFYACFISYSSKDQEFADRLYADLQNKGVRCWLASEDMKIGQKIRSSIDEAIRLHEKLLLVLSKHSVSSDWVEQEVETALQRERREKNWCYFQYAWMMR